jgi:hypothetical protein
MPYRLQDRKVPHIAQSFSIADKNSPSAFVLARMLYDRHPFLLNGGVAFPGNPTFRDTQPLNDSLEADTSATPNRNLQPRACDMLWNSFMQLVVQGWDFRGAI